MQTKQIILRITIAITAFFLGVFIFLNSSHFEISEVKEYSMPDDAQISALDEEYEVFSAVLATFYSNEEIVISDEAFDNTSIKAADIDQKYYDLNEETINNYINKRTAKLENKFTIQSKVFLLTKEEEQNLFPKGGAGWDKFYQKYPKAKGIIRFSNVGFNKEKTEALVRIIHQCNGFCAEYGSYYSLKKSNGKWEVIRKTRG